MLAGRTRCPASRAGLSGHGQAAGSRLRGVSTLVAYRPGYRFPRDERLTRTVWIAAHTRPVARHPGPGTTTAAPSAAAATSPVSGLRSLTVTFATGGLGHVSVAVPSVSNSALMTWPLLIMPGPMASWLPEASMGISGFEWPPVSEASSLRIGVPRSRISHLPSSKSLRRISRRLRLSTRTETTCGSFSAWPLRLTSSSGPARSRAPVLNSAVSGNRL